MRLAFSTRPFSDRSLTEAIRTIGQIGFDAVEIVADFPHALPAHVTPAVLDLVKTALAESGVRAPALSALTMSMGADEQGPSWIDPDASVRNERFRYTLDCIRMAAVLGASFVITPAGGPWNGRHGAAESRAYDWLEQGLHRLTPFAEEFGVTVLAEGGPGMLVETSRQLRHLLKRLEHPAIRASLDVGHAYMRGEEPADVVRDLGPWLTYLHAADVPSSREHIHVVPGQGAIDFEEIGQALTESRYRGFLSVDVLNFDDTADAAAVESLEVLRRRL